MPLLSERLRNVSTHENSSPHETSARSICNKVVLWGLSALVLALGATNVLTLTDNDFHSKMYKIVEAAGRMAWAEPMFVNSPTETRKREMEAASRQRNAATMALVAQSAILVDATMALVRTHESLRQSHRVLAAASSSLSRRVAIRTAKGATRGVTTLAGRTIPYLGVASLVALTAYDVADACETLKDLNELAIAAGDQKGSEEATVCGMSVPTVEEAKAWITQRWR